MISNIYSNLHHKKVKIKIWGNIYVAGRIIDYHYEPEDKGEEEEEGILVEVEESNKIPKNSYILPHEEEIIKVDELLE